MLQSTISVEDIQLSDKILAQGNHDTSHHESNFIKSNNINNVSSTFKWGRSNDNIINRAMCNRLFDKFVDKQW